MPSLHWSSSMAKPGLHWQKKPKPGQIVDANGEHSELAVEQSSLSMHSWWSKEVVLCRLETDWSNNDVNDEPNSDDDVDCDDWEQLVRMNTNITSQEELMKMAPHRCGINLFFIATVVLFVVVVVVVVGEFHFEKYSLNVHCQCYAFSLPPVLARGYQPPSLSRSLSLFIHILLLLPLFYWPLNIICMNCSPFSSRLACCANFLFIAL